MIRKLFYSIIALLFTTVTLVTLIALGNIGMSIENQFIGEYEMIDDSENDRYLGYIFEDYNKPVNLNYADKEIVRPLDAVNTMSLSNLDLEYSKDNIRSLRSERLIEERAKQEEESKEIGLNSVTLNEELEVFNSMEAENKPGLIYITSTPEENDK